LADDVGSDEILSCQSSVFFLYQSSLACVPSVRIGLSVCRVDLTLTLILLLTLTLTLTLHPYSPIPFPLKLEPSLFYPGPNPVYIIPLGRSGLSIRLLILCQLSCNGGHVPNGKKDPPPAGRSFLLNLRLSPRIKLRL
jgi:hypothetical protein